MTDFSQLTQRQKEIYEFIRDKIEGRGYGPTVREIGDGFGIESPNGVMCHLKALEKKGLITRRERSRGPSSLWIAADGFLVANAGCRRGRLPCRGD